MAMPHHEPITISNLSELAEQLRWFDVSARYFETHVDELMEKYDGRWVGIYRGELVDDAPSLDALLAGLDQRGVPKQFTFVRRMWQSGLPLVT